MAEIIKGIKSIDDYRVFQRWRRQPATKQFERVSVIYGVNGSGKSTLASLLRECAAVPCPSSGLTLEVGDSHGTRDVTDNDRTFWNRVHVFDEAYVNEELSFDDANGPSPKSLLTLGKATIDAEKALETKRGRLAEANAEMLQVQHDAGTAQSELDKRLTALGTRIGDDLGSSGVVRHRARSYTSRQVKKALEEG
ncbi:MAG: AAA family ATPase [Propionibacteriaceae bacterium]|jgi:wobble nucleotide-excising tRNase|nr:AAA family ATPase [Propionibacteriaceae bacterium]